MLEGLRLATDAPVEAGKGRGNRSNISLPQVLGLRIKIRIRFCEFSANKIK